DHDVRPGDGLIPLASRPGGLTGDLGLEALDRPRLVQVQGQPLRLALDDVGEHDLVENGIPTRRRRGGRAGETRADDGYLARACHLEQTPSSVIRASEPGSDTTARSE